MNSGRIRILFLILADVFTLSASWLGTALVYQAMGGRYEMSTYIAMWPFLFVFVLLASVVRLYHGNLLYPGMALDQVEETRRMSTPCSRRICCSSATSRSPAAWRISPAWSSWSAPP